MVDPDVDDAADQALAHVVRTRRPSARTAPGPGCGLGVPAVPLPTHPRDGARRHNSRCPSPKVGRSATSARRRQRQPLGALQTPLDALATGLGPTVVPV
eukprot:16436496-Heterocapsa_arctica.AAC.1